MHLTGIIGGRNISRGRLEHIGKENCNCYFFVLLLYIIQDVKFNYNSTQPWKFPWMGENNQLWRWLPESLPLVPKLSSFSHITEDREYRIGNTAWTLAYLSSTKQNELTQPRSPYFLTLHGAVTNRQKKLEDRERVRQCGRLDKCNFHTEQTFFSQRHRHEKMAGLSLRSEY